MIYTQMYFDFWWELGFISWLNTVKEKIIPMLPYGICELFEENDKGIIFQMDLITKE